MKLKTIAAIICILTLLPIVTAAQPLTCTIAAGPGACAPPSVALLNLASPSGGHAELSVYSNYNNEICCTGVSPSTVLTSNTEPILRLSTETNAHVEIPSQTNYETILYMRQPGPGTIDCSYETSPSTCAADEECVLSISNPTTNAHVGQCNAYSTNLCCRICLTTPGEFSMEVSCFDGKDNDCDWLIDGADPDCPCTITETPETTCNDCIDNDCDGYMDGADSDCPGTACIPTPGQETTETSCSDGIDNDCDCLFDDQDGDGCLDTGDDPDCFAFTPGDACTTTVDCPGTTDFCGTCMDDPTDACPICPAGQPCQYMTLFGETCSGTCSDTGSPIEVCVDNGGDGCPSCTAGGICINTFVTATGPEQCQGRYDNPPGCDCIDIDDNCPSSPPLNPSSWCGNGVIENVNLGEQCDSTLYLEKYTTNGAPDCTKVPTPTATLISTDPEVWSDYYKSGAASCGASGTTDRCKIIGCSPNACLAEETCNAQCGTGYSNNYDGPGDTDYTCYSNPQCTALCGSRVELDTTAAKNVVTQKKITISQQGKPIVVNVVVWES